MSAKVRHRISAVNDRPIADYALIGDMRGSALVAADGAIEWLCLDRFDADPVLFGMLDVGLGGVCTVTVDDASPAGRRYRPGTNIVETTFESRHGTVVVTDFMPVRARRDAGEQGADSEAPRRLVRRVQCTSGRVDASLRCRPSFDWARRDAVPVLNERGAFYAGEGLRVATSHAVSLDGDDLVCNAALGAGDTLVLVLANDGDLSHAVDETRRQLDETEAYWLAWHGECHHGGPDRDLVGRSALCLKLLTYAPTGAMVAAPTTGLPEAAGGVRNWDYRFVWTRDASFAVSAFLTIGYRREAAEFLRFLHAACAGGDVVKVVYAVDGPMPGERRLTHLAGWRGSVPVLLGNAAAAQAQNEIYGEILASIGLYVDMHGTDGLCPALKRDLPDFVHRLAEAAVRHWRLPDQGIWELRGEPRHLLHSKMMCWVALDRAMAMAPRIGLVVPGHWASERDAVRRDCLDRGWNDRLGAFTMELDGELFDMSVLRMSIMDFLPADDPRMVATSAALERELGHGDLYFRYRFDDGIPGREGAFVACSFWVANLMARRGGAHQDRARAMTDRLLARANDVGLFAEQFEVESGEHLGNFPQSFTHMSLIHLAVRLASAA